MATTTSSNSNTNRNQKQLSTTRKTEAALIVYNGTGTKFQASVSISTA